MLYVLHKVMNGTEVVKLKLKWQDAIDKLHAILHQRVQHHHAYCRVHRVRQSGPASKHLTDVNGKGLWRVEDYMNQM